MDITKSDIEMLQAKGISEEKLAEELQMLANGFPFLKIEVPATPGNGIFVLNEQLEEQSANLWNEYLDKGEGAENGACQWCRFPNVQRSFLIRQRKKGETGQ